MGRKKIVIRADAEQRMGAGHIMRCIALAQAWQETGCDAVFLISNSSKLLEKRIFQEGFPVIFLSESGGTSDDADQTLAIAHQKNAGWVVLDGYQFGDDYQERIKKGDFKLLVIDDYGHAKNMHADIVLNPNIYASMALYPDSLPETRFLLGGRYSLIRREFLKKKKQSGEQNVPVPKKILVTMGGSDPDNVTTMVLNTLLPLVSEFELSVTAVIGGMNKHFDPGDSPYSDDPRVRIVRATDDMASLICNADLVITGAGSTTWEIAYLGRSMIAVVITGNQEKVGTALEMAGAAVVIKSPERIPDCLGAAVRDLISYPDKRMNIIAAGQKLIDGEGTGRVVMVMQEARIRLREVRNEDRELLLRWANDPVVRKNAFNEAPIDRETHEQWFAGRVSSADCTIYIAVDALDNPVGQIRFDREGESAKVDISIDPLHRKKGRGVELLTLGTAKIFHNMDIKNINASVKTQNIASIKMFKQAGFTLEKNDRIGATEVVNFVYPRSHFELKRNT